LTGMTKVTTVTYASLDAGSREVDITLMNIMSAY
jgi:hypothetical protein